MYCGFKLIDAVMLYPYKSYDYDVIFEWIQVITKCNNYCCKLTSTAKKIH